MKLKTLYLTTLVLLVLVSFPTIYVAGATSDNFTLSQGIYPQATYTLFREGNTYYAKNRYGRISYSGTNATTIVQNALDALTSGRTYRETVKLIGSFLINQIALSSYTTFDLTDAFLKLNDNQNQDMIINKDRYTTGNWDIEIFGGILDGNGDDQTQKNVIAMGNTTHVWIHNVKIQNPYGNAIRLIDSTKATIEGNHLINNYDGDLLGLVDSTFITITNNIVEYADRYPIDLYRNCDHNLIDGNLIQYAGYDGIALIPDASTTCRWNVISNNIIRYCSADGIAIGGDPDRNAHYTVVSGNMLQYNNGSGIFIRNSLGWSVTGNVIEWSGDCGIKIHSCEDGTITGNTIMRNGQNATAYDRDGITLTNDENNCRYIVISGNRIYDDQGSKTQQWGIKEKDVGAYATDYNTIIANDCHHHAVGGIKIVGANTKVNLCWNGTTWIS